MAAALLPELLVVAVDGGNSFFVDGRAGRYQEMVTKDLIAHVEASYRVVPGRAARAVLGVSMGGYAALHIALAQPELFAAVATHSAMLLARVPSAEQGAGRWQMTAFHAVFGDPIDPGLWSQNDPLAWARKVEAKGAPALYFDCGADDRYGLASGHRELHRILERAPASRTPSSCHRAITATRSSARGSRRAWSFSAARSAGDDQPATDSVSRARTIAPRGETALPRAVIERWATRRHRRRASWRASRP